MLRRFVVGCVNLDLATLAEHPPIVGETMTLDERRTRDRSVRAAYLLFIAIFALGLVQPVSAQSSTSNLPAKQTPHSAQFVDITKNLGIHFDYKASHTSQKYLLETMGAGVALFDCDGDGRLDIFFVNGARIDDPMPKGKLPIKDGRAYWNRLFHQKPDGKFEDIPEKSGLGGEGYGMGVAVGDYDNDGREDLYVTGFPRNHLYHNNGNCQFEDVTDAAGVAASGWSASAAFVDVDNDGLLDLAVTRYLDWSFETNPYCGEHEPGHRGYCSPDIFHGVSPLLYHNDGNGHFTDVSDKAGWSKLEGKGLGVAFADMDHDGLPDIVIANDAVRGFLLHNQGQLRFSEIAVEAGTAVNEDGRAYSGMGVDFADYDNDGNPDIVITDLSDQKYPLYHNSGDGTFSYETGPSGLGAITRPFAGWGVKFFDYDNDGWKDLFVAQGHVMDTIQFTFPHLRYLQPPLLLHNERGKKFNDVSADSGTIFQQKWAARGLAVGDLDNDGRLDVVVTTNTGPVYVLHNQGGTGSHWLTLKLIGHKSNRDGIGAEVKLVAPSGAMQYVTATTSGSYLSASDGRVHFGLGSENSAKLIEIHWPSGIVQRLENVKADGIVNVDEPFK
ncbi:MAG TPA: CRTAC1 family protein [Candidatus Sulfotelmatobacter sp.]|nr:CRTAC1 family protein [Candidatus Sulfotelmatobacter sp.]